jgi:hypothetical protein
MGGEEKGGRQQDASKVEMRMEHKSNTSRAAAPAGNKNIVYHEFT